MTLMSQIKRGYWKQSIIKNSMPTSLVTFTQLNNSTKNRSYLNLHNQKGESIINGTSETYALIFSMVNYIKHLTQIVYQIIQSLFQEIEAEGNFLHDLWSDTTLILKPDSHFKRGKFQVGIFQVFMLKVITKLLSHIF